MCLGRLSNMIDVFKCNTKNKEIWDFGKNLFSQQYEIDSQDGIMTCLTSYLQLWSSYQQLKQ